MKNLNKIRDELADNFLNRLEKKYSQIELANMPSIISEESFKCGFDCGVSEIKKIVEPLVGALKGIALKLPECINSTELEYAMRICAQQALEQYKKDVSE